LAQLGERLAAGVNAHIELLELVAGPPVAFNLVAEHAGHVMALHLRARGEFLLTGDLMRSVTLLRLDEVSRKLVRVARDYAPGWMTAVAFAGEDSYVGCTQEGNLMLLGRSEEAESLKLRDLGCYHLGACINVLREGRLVMPDPTLTVPPPAPLLYGAVDGSIGALVPLSDEKFAFFKALEEKMATLPSVGNISHAEWRGVGRRKHTAFVDGDLVERFPELALDDQMAVAAGLELSHSEIVQRVEDMARSIH
jgi:DNA damage-binding protein 1